MATNTSNTASTWMEVLIPTGPNREENRTFAAQLVEEWNSATSAMTAWQSATITKGTALLAKVEGVENPVVIHHPSTAKGKRTLAGTTKEEFFVLQGTGNPALVYGIDPEEVFKSSGQLEAPEFRHFMRAKDMAELHDIHTREIGQGSIIKLTSAIPKHLKTSFYFLPPPLKFQKVVMKLIVKWTTHPHS